MPDNSRPTVLADAAIGVLAQAGSRGFTHRAVDRAAGVPEGSTSFYFRTRQHLLRATVERLAALDTDTLYGPNGPTGRGRSGLLDDLAETVEHLLTAGRDRLLARYELSLEATRRPELEQVLRANRAAVRAALADQLHTAGATDPQRSAEELLILLDGLLLNQVTNLASGTLHGTDLRERLAHFLTAAGAYPAHAS